MTTSNMRYGSLTAVYADSSTYPCALGQVWTNDQTGASYVFAYNAGATSTAAGDCAGIYDSSGTTYGYVSVTAATILDCSDGTTTRSMLGGVALSVVATTVAGWFWFDGYGTHSITTDGNVAKGQSLILADGAILATPNATAATAHWMPIGQALADDASTTLSKAVLGGPGVFRWARSN